MGEERDFPWTDFDLRDLKRYFKEFEGKYGGEKLIKIVAFKLRRNEKDVLEKMIELQLPLSGSPNRSPIKREEEKTKDVIILKKPDFKNNRSEELPDIGELLTKIKHDTSLQHNDVMMLEQKITGKLERVIGALDELACTQREILALQKEYIVVVREQHEAWKTKNDSKDRAVPTKSNSSFRKMVEPSYLSDTKQKNIVTY